MLDLSLIRGSFFRLLFQRFPYLRGLQKVRKGIALLRLQLRRHAAHS
jgi:hypothetical protein